ncbi:hypothetical protein M378DRAFT_85848, partial [Amanita muscaria Koide BX008]
VKRSTLHDRMKGRHRPMSKYAESQRFLNPDEETILLDWACLNSASATPLRVTDLRSIASDICGAVPGDKWARGFLKRHKDTLIKHTPCNLDPKRARNFNKTVVTDYFNLRRDVEERYGPIPPEHHYNMDEKGIQMGGGRKNDGTKYIFSRTHTDFYCQQSDNLELVTVIECGNAAGIMIPPHFVLKEGPMPDPNEDDRLLNVGMISTSKSGWTDRDICLDWFRTVFVPHAESCRVNDKPIVLTVDGHDSHETDGVKEMAYQAGIIIIALPSKTTHKLQPLDVGVFSVLQRKWTRQCRDRLAVGVKMN